MAVNPVLHFLRRIRASDQVRKTPDAELLARFVASRDEAAFTALVQRHGPMVLRLCVRVLGDSPDAEDAFQAAFLVLARRAPSVSRPELLGNWLYGVAYRTAIKVRAGAARRQSFSKHERAVDRTDPVDETARRELQRVVDHELSRLPDRYRLPLVLHYLEGRTQEEVAQLLGCPRKTITTRLARACERLRGRLTRRGLALSSAGLAAALSEEASAALPATLLYTTVKAATLFAAGGSALAPTVVSLAERVIQTMFLTKVKIALGFFFMLATLGSGTVLFLDLVPAHGQKPQVLYALSRGSGIPAPSPDNKEPTRPFVQWAVAKEFVKNAPNDALVVNDMVIVGTNQGDLRAYRCKDGESIWVHQHGARIFHRPCSDGQRVYFTSAKGLTAVRLLDGTRAWSFPLACCDGPTFVLGKQEMAYVGGNDGNLYALDAKTGKRVWVSDFLADAPPDPPGFSGNRGRLTNTKTRPSALASDGEALFLSVFDQCRVVAVSAANGKRLWAFQTGGWIRGSAVATEKFVFFGSQDMAFYCLDKRTGKKVWNHRTKGHIDSGGTVDEKFVYFGSFDGGVYCLNQSDGKARWRFATDQYNGRNSTMLSVPLLCRSTVYTAAGNQLYAIDQHTGQLKWKIRPSEGSMLLCATDGARFFVVTLAERVGFREASLVAIGVK